MNNKYAHGGGKKNKIDEGMEEYLDRPNGDYLHSAEGSELVSGFQVRKLVDSGIDLSNELKVSENSDITKEQVAKALWLEDEKLIDLMSSVNYFLGCQDEDGVYCSQSELITTLAEAKAAFPTVDEKKLLETMEIGRKIRLGWQVERIFSNVIGYSMDTKFSPKPKLGEIKYYKSWDTGEPRKHIVDDFDVRQWADYSATFEGLVIRNNLVEGSEVYLEVKKIWDDEEKSSEVILKDGLEKVKEIIKNIKPGIIGYLETISNRNYHHTSYHDLISGKTSGRPVYGGEMISVSGRNNSKYLVINGQEIFQFRGSPGSNLYDTYMIFDKYVIAQKAAEFIKQTEALLEEAIGDKKMISDEEINNHR